jgi:hypothetical protein
MKIINGRADLMKAAFADFKRSKIRTILTSLGIMVGVLSVVLLIALGIGLKNYQILLLFFPAIFHPVKVGVELEISVLDLRGELNLMKRM